MKLIVTGYLMLLLCSGIARAEAQAPGVQTKSGDRLTSKPPSLMPPSRAAWPKASYGWIDAALDEKEDAGLSRLCKEIDEQVVLVDPALLMQRFEKELVTSPESRTSRAGWAYVAYKRFARRRPGDKRDETQKNLNRAVWILRKMEIGHSPVMYRLRFLVESAGFKDPEIVRAGKRLFEQAPQDLDVKWRYAFLLGASAEREVVAVDAVRLLDDLIRTDPGNYMYFNSKGMVYWTLLEITKNLEYGERAKQLYEKAGDLANNSDDRDFCHWAMQRIAEFMVRIAIARKP